jgi:hypothetical protein
MKLYTELEVRKAIEFASELKKVEQRKDFKEWFVNPEDIIINNLTPIELPSDDDICDEAESIAHNYFIMQKNHYQGLEEGAKRMAYWLMKNFKQ